MKLYLSLIAAIIVIFFSFPAKAQVHFDVNVNIGSQPVWGPAGYDYAEYYYLPDIDVYYSVPRGIFFYTESGCWVGRRTLPARYRNYDLYHGYKVVVNENEPWRRHEYYQRRYSEYCGRHDQMIIRDYRHENRNRHEYERENDNWKHEGRHDNGKHLGWYKNGKR